MKIAGLPVWAAPFFKKIFCKKHLTYTYVYDMIETERRSTDG